MDKKTDDPDTYPALGRALLWVDKPGSVNKIFGALAVACAGLFIYGFTFPLTGIFIAERIPGFFAIYGFVMFTGLVLFAKLMRVFIKRPEDYYGNKAVDSEVYPPEELGMEPPDA